MEFPFFNGHGSPRRVGNRAAGSDLVFHRVLPLLDGNIHHFVLRVEDPAAIGERCSKSCKWSVYEPAEPLIIRSATPKQLRAIDRLALRAGKSPDDFYHERLETTVPCAMSIAEASPLIVELQLMTHSDRQLAGFERRWLWDRRDHY